MFNAYVPNSGSGNVSVIDTSTDTVSTTVTLAAHVTGAAVTPDGRYAYITNNNDNNVKVIDTSNNTVIATTAVGTGADGVAITPSGRYAYVTDFGSNNVKVIDTSTNTVVATITVGNGATGIAITPDGKKAYVTNYNAGTVSVIDTSTNTVSTTVTVGTDPSGVAITPDGSKAYVLNESSGNVSVIDTSTDTVKTGAGYPITVGTDPVGIAITPDGGKAYVTNYGSASVSVIATSTDTVSKTITVGTDPYGVAITPDGGKAYVANSGSGTVSVIDTSTDTVKTGAGYPITVGTTPEAFGIFIQPASIIMTNLYTAPQGRLTLTSATPVMTADATAQTSVYYTPYQGNLVSIYDGANMNSYTFSELTMALNTSNQTSGHIYDLFVFLNSGVVTIGASPAWSSSTSRGTGAGTTELQQVDGLWTNKNTITLKNGSTTYSNIAANKATYVGSVYMTANGQTGMQFLPVVASGGNNSMLGLFNAYNQVLVKSNSADTANSWTYSTAAWRSANGSNSNRINWLDGLQQSFVDAYYQCAISQSSTNGYIGICLNGTSTPNLASHDPECNSSSIIPLSSRETVKPQLGFNFVQAVEYSSGSTATFYGGGSQMWLEVSLMM